MIDIETVTFIEMLNELARRFGNNATNRIIPFSKKDKGIIDECLKSIEPEKVAFFYDDTNLIYSTEEADYYPLIQQMSIDELHDDIVFNYDDVFVAVYKEDGFKPYVCVYPEGIGDGICFIIDKGFWHSV